jgi:regulator of sirC expression with transglutaminase-like and TPR domain
MQLSYTVPSPMEYFATLVQSDESFPLLEAAISIGQDEYPDMDVQQVLGEVDQLLARLKRRVPADAVPLQKLRALNQFFFRDLSFRGNVNNYYDPDNSFISVVLKTRCAIPISLAVLWLELAQGMGLAARGVGFPGHFMVKVNLPKGQVVIDPMDGQSLSREQLSERLEPFRRRSGLVDEFEVPLGLYLQAAPARDIIARMLRNLKEIYRTQEDWPPAGGAGPPGGAAAPGLGRIPRPRAWPMPSWATPRRRFLIWKVTSRMSRKPWTSMPSRPGRPSCAGHAAAEPPRLPARAAARSVRRRGRLSALRGWRPAGSAAPDSRRYGWPAARPAGCRRAGFQQRQRPCRSARSRCRR